MVLSRRHDGVDNGSSKNVFDGSAEKNVGRFFFVYENVTMRGKSDAEKATEVLCYIEGDVFNFYYDIFAKEGVLIEEAKDYSVVKTALIDQFAQPEEPEDNIRRAISAHLESRDLVGSLRELDRCYEKVGFNAEAKFGLLRNAVMQYPDLAPFAIYRGSTTYEDLKKTVRDFVSSRTVFFSSRGSMPGQASAADIAPKTVLKRPDALERKVDALTDQLAQLSLMVKKNQASGGAPSSVGRVCSYCKRAGHRANKCDINPHRDTKCPRCGKFGRSETTCWMKITPEMTRKVGFQGVRSESEVENKLAAREENKDTPGQVAVVTESTEDEVVAAAKRNAAGQALPKQQRTDIGIPIPTLLNKVPAPVPFHHAPKQKLRGRKDKQRKKPISRKPGIHEYVGKYNVLEELARAPSGLTFGQLICGDADEAKVEIRKTLAKGARSGCSIIAQVEGGVHQRRLKVVTVKVYGTMAQALLDSGAVPNLVSSSLADVVPRHSF